MGQDHHGCWLCYLMVISKAEAWIFQTTPTRMPCSIAQYTRVQHNDLTSTQRKWWDTGIWLMPRKELFGSMTSPPRSFIESPSGTMVLTHKYSGTGASSFLAAFAFQAMISAHGSDIGRPIISLDSAATEANSGWEETHRGFSLTVGADLETLIVSRSKTLSRALIGTKLVSRVSARIWPWEIILQRYSGKSKMAHSSTKVKWWRTHPVGE